MDRVYRCSFLSLVWNMLLAVLAVTVAYFLSGIILENIFNNDSFIVNNLPVIIASIVAILFILYIFKSIRTKLIVSDDSLRIYYGRKEYSYKLKEISCTSEIRNNILTLYIDDNKGNVEDFDLSLLGSVKFESLLHDLGVVGDNSPVHKVNVIKNENNIKVK